MPQRMKNHMARSGLEPRTSRIPCELSSQLTYRATRSTFDNCFFFFFFLFSSSLSIIATVRYVLSFLFLFFSECVGYCTCALSLVCYCLFLFSSLLRVGYCKCALCHNIACSFCLLLSVSVIAIVRCVLSLIVPFLFFLCRLLQLCAVTCHGLFVFSSPLYISFFGSCALCLGIVCSFSFCLSVSFLQLCVVSCHCVYTFSLLLCVGYCNCAMCLVCVCFYFLLSLLHTFGISWVLSSIFYKQMVSDLARLRGWAPDFLISTYAGHIHTEIFYFKFT